MLVPKTFSRKKTMVLSGVVVLAVGLTIYLIVANLGSGVIPSSFSSGGQSNVPLPAAAAFDANFFTDPAISQLENVGDLPVQVGTLGNADPFKTTPSASGAARR